jgi:predicted nucleotidyltransferase
MQIKTLCEYLGGSHAYGLNTPQSDIDKRGVFLNTEPAYILGLNQFNEQRNQVQNQCDTVYKEISHTLRLLANGNVEALEALFTTNYSKTNPEFDSLLRGNKAFLDSKRLFHALKGYIFSEKKIATGERKGSIGGKRSSQIEEFGFSPKNFSHLIRLATVGINFFTEDRITINLQNESSFQLILDIKTKPQNFTKEELIRLTDDHETRLNKAFDNRKIDRVFNTKLANETLLTLYKPFLRNHEEDPPQKQS